MAFLKSLCIAFTFFSAFPFFRAEWNEKNLRFLFCAFPFVGVFEGVLCAAFFALSKRFFAQFVLESASVFVLLPILFTGAIHFDGFLDTADALFSRAPREKKLQILKDSRVGSGAVVSAAFYLLFYFVISQNLFKNVPFDFKICFSIILIFVLSRSFSALAAASFPCASSGLLKLFVDSSAKRSAFFFNFVLICAIFFASIFFLLNAFKAGILIFLSELALFFHYYAVSKKEFGGITGDIAGFFVQTAEIAALFSLSYFGV